MRTLFRVCRCSAADSARCYALAVAVVFRLLPSQHLVPLYAWRHAQHRVVADRVQLDDVRFSAVFRCFDVRCCRSPAATELETIVLDWFGRAMQLPDKFLSSSKGVGIIQGTDLFIRAVFIVSGTASEATLVAMIAARTRAIESYAKQHPEMRDPDAVACIPLCL